MPDMIEFSWKDLWVGIKLGFKDGLWNYFHPFSKWRKTEMNTTLKQKQVKQV